MPDQPDLNQSCTVPECKDGYVRVPIVIHRRHYGTTETFARMDDIQCDECGGLGRVPRAVFRPAGGED